MNYNPFNCEKILNMNSPMGQECHGCPFKTYSAENLRKILETCNLNPVIIEEIMNKKIIQIFIELHFILPLFILIFLYDPT